MIRARRWTLFFLLGVLGNAAQARVNLLEPWTPGFDTDLPSERWNHAVNLRVGRGARGTDVTELGYAFTTPVAESWEVGGSWGYASIDAPGARSESGLTDLALAAKYRVSANAVPKPGEAVLEAGITLPIGDSDKGLGAGGLGFLGAVGFKHPVASLSAHVRGEMGYFMESSNTRWGRVLGLVAGAEKRVDAEWTVTGDVRAHNHGRDKIDGVLATERRTEIYLAPGGRWAPKNAPLALRGNLLIGLSRDAFDFGLLVGAAF